MRSESAVATLFGMHPLDDRVKHRRAPRPIVFPVEVQVPESIRHLKLRTALMSILEQAFATEAAIGSDQFVYWNARDPRRCLAPDVFVKVGVSNEPFDTWKTWERGGPPELAVEIVSDSDASDLRLEEKLVRYHELGTRAVVRFDPAALAGERLRAWDRIAEDLVERIVEADTTPCAVLGLQWVVAPLAGFPIALRLAREAGDLLPTAEESARADADAARAEVDRAAERIAALEAALERQKQT